jgi:hypothetical protein
MSVSSEYNPYAPLKETAVPAEQSPLVPWVRVIRQFRQEANALAGVAFFYAVCTGMISRSALTAGYDNLKVIIVAGMGWAALTLFIAGVQIAMKKMTGVRILLFLNYALLLTVVFLTTAAMIGAGTGGFFVILFLAGGPSLVAVQCHRVLRTAKRLTSAGIPLSLRPHELMTESFRQVLEPLQS